MVFSLYFSQILVVLRCIDITINILCLNLQYQYGYKLYMFFKCNKLEEKCQKCIVWCYNNNHNNSNNKCPSKKEFCQCFKFIKKQSKLSMKQTSPAMTSQSTDE